MLILSELKLEAFDLNFIKYFLPFLNGFKITTLYWKQNSVSSNDHLTFVFEWQKKKKLHRVFFFSSFDYVFISSLGHEWSQGFCSRKGQVVFNTFVCGFDYSDFCLVFIELSTLSVLSHCCTGHASSLEILKRKISS